MLISLLIQELIVGKIFIGFTLCPLILLRNFLETGVSYQNLDSLFTMNFDLVPLDVVVVVFISF